MDEHIKELINEFLKNKEITFQGIVPKLRFEEALKTINIPFVLSNINDWNYTFDYYLPEKLKRG